MLVKIGYVYVVYELKLIPKFLVRRDEKIKKLCHFPQS